MGRVSVLALVVTAAAIGCGTDELCAGDDVRTALAAAASGDVVMVGACRITAPVVVPAGVTLRGEGPTSSAVVLTDGNVAVALGEGAALENIAVESAGRIAVIVRNVSARLSMVTVRITTGVGIGAENARLTMTDVQVIGPVTQATANTLPPVVTATLAATHGVALINVASATLTNVSVRGMAQYGLLSESSTVSMTGGALTENLGVGLYVQGGVIGLDGVEIAETINGVRLIPSYGAVFRSGARVTTGSLLVERGDGFGVLHDRANATHADLMVRDNGFAGIWVQQSTMFSLDRGTIEDNRFAGLALVRASGVNVRDTTIARTAREVRTLGLLGRLESGDGIQVIGETSGVRIERTVLDANGRVGVLADLDGTTFDAAALATVEVRNTPPMGFGVVAQRGMLPAGWDQGVQRDSVARTNDATFVDVIDAVGIVGPCIQPDVGPLPQVGLSHLIGF